MTIEALQKAMIDAMKAKDKPRKEAISSLVAAVKRVAIDNGCRDSIPEDMVDAAILKEVKSIKEQIETCPASREDLLTEYKTRLSFVEEFAPKLMSAEEVKAMLLDQFKEVIDGKNKGLIMKTVMPALKGKADGKVINQVVAELLK